MQKFILWTVVLLFASVSALIWIGGNARTAPADEPVPCIQAWGPTLKSRPDMTCAPLTDRLIAELKGATRAEVVKAMSNEGRSELEGKRVHLHYSSAADSNSGVINFTFNDQGKAHLIFGAVDNPGRGGPFLFYHGMGATPCSDVPGSRYQRCR